MSTVRTVVVGAGRMGTGIAQALLLAGAEVVLVDSETALVDRGIGRVRNMVARSAERGSLDGDLTEVISRLQGQVGVRHLPDAELAVEAVPEDAELKISILTELERQLSDGAVLATNTSSISIDDLACTLRRPGRFLGMHFFNPVPASSLVELVYGRDTSDVALERAQRWIDQMGKTAIVVKNSPGFASSRLGVAIGLEAIRMVSEGVASAEDIDQAMVLGYRFPVGPLRLTDKVGLDVRLGIADYLSGQLGPRFAPPELLRDMVARGDVGQKAGRGFYEWPS